MTSTAVSQSTLPHPIFKVTFFYVTWILLLGFYNPCTAEGAGTTDAELQQEMSVTPAPPSRLKLPSGPPAGQYKYAAYMADWERKIETVGSVNFPDEVRRRNLQHNLLLDVAIHPDGSLVEVAIRRSSGNKLVDDAALRIVYLAAPFAPFPPSFLKDFTVLHITRTWHFSPNGTVDTE